MQGTAKHAQTAQTATLWAVERVRVKIQQNALLVLTGIRQRSSTESAYVRGHLLKKLTVKAIASTATLTAVLLVWPEIFIPVCSVRIPWQRLKTESVSVVKELCLTQECVAATATPVTRRSAARPVRVLGSAFNALINIRLT